MNLRCMAAVAAVGFVVLAGAAGTARAAVWMDFSRVYNTWSTLRYTWQDDSTGQQRATQSWRAGSGYTTNDCQSGAGWLPTGFYDVRGHWDHYDGSAIKGRVWYLSDKRCNGGSGTLRTELFIHSEETADDGQYCPTSYDDPFCWEGDSDYKSSGCIKVAHEPPWPSDIAQADNDWDSWDGRHGWFTFVAGLYVH